MNCKKHQITSKGEPLRITADSQEEILEWSSFKLLKQVSANTDHHILWKYCLKSEEIKTFHDNQKLKKFMATKLNSDEF